MRTRLSVNLNKVALIRNSRGTNVPSVIDAAKIAINAGAEGITVHPRPDMRHIRPQDVYALSELLVDDQYKHVELNIEGNPYAGPEKNGFPGFIELVQKASPTQCTLVPDKPTQLTSDHGWDFNINSKTLSPIVRRLHKDNIRVSLFVDPTEESVEMARALRSDRVELFTGPYAASYKSSNQMKVLNSFRSAAKFAQSVGIGVNAGHDLNLENLAEFCEAVVPLQEVSIGHAIISDAIWLGLEETINRYIRILN